MCSNLFSITNNFFLKRSSFSLLTSVQYARDKGPYSTVYENSIPISVQLQATVSNDNRIGNGVLFGFDLSVNYFFSIFKFFEVGATASYYYSSFSVSATDSSGKSYSLFLNSLHEIALMPMMKARIPTLPVSPFIDFGFGFIFPLQNNDTKYLNQPMALKADLGIDAVLSSHLSVGFLVGFSTWKGLGYSTVFSFRI